jgi:hypothetical protein
MPVEYHYHRYGAYAMELEDTLQSALRRARYDIEYNEAHTEKIVREDGTVLDHEAVLEQCGYYGNRDGIVVDGSSTPIIDDPTRLLESEEQSMAAVPGQSLENEEDIANNPWMQGLKDFILVTLKRPLAEISHWDILVTHPESGYAEFSVRFGDGTEGYTGTIRQGLDGCRVHTFRALLIVSGISPAVHDMLTSTELERVSRLVEPRISYEPGKLTYQGSYTLDILQERDMTYQEKCTYIAAHAKPAPVTAEEAHEHITQALTHPLLDLFLTADDLADAIIRTIKQNEQ